VTDLTDGLPWRTYPHMCRDQHEQIGHSDSEQELCPVCRALALTRQLAEALQELKRHVVLDLTPTQPVIDQINAALAAAKDAGIKVT
jgi:hypothetical protein